MPPESASSAGVSRSELGASSKEDATVPLRAPAQPGAGAGAAGSAGSAGGFAPAGQAGAPSGLGGDWPAQLTHKVEETVALVRDKTVTPVGKAVRYLILGLVTSFIGVTIAVLFAIFSIRVLDTEIPVFRTRVWASWFIVAGIFWLAGLLLNSKRRSRS